MCYNMSYMYVLSYVFDVFVILCVIGVQVLSTVKKPYRTQPFTDRYIYH